MFKNTNKTFYLSFSFVFNHATFLVLICFLSSCSLFFSQPEVANDLRLYSDIDKAKRYFSRRQELDDYELAYVKKKSKDVIEVTVTASKMDAANQVSELAAADIGMLPKSSEASSLARISQEAESDTLEEVVFGVKDSSPSITNNQEETVDEGGIIKRFGDYLVVLMNGHLYSVNVSAVTNEFVVSDSLSLKYFSGLDDAWYDEMLVSNDRVLVMAYDYDSGSTGLIYIQIDESGKFEYEQTYLIQSSDYFDSDNYATRLIGNTLHFYMPIYLYGYDDGFVDELFSPLQAIYFSKEQGGIDNASMKTIESKAQWFEPVEHPYYPAVFKVIKCPLDTPTLSCDITHILSSEDTSFYVSKDAFYLWSQDSFPAIDLLSVSNAGYMRWLNHHEKIESENSFIYRIPHDGSMPTAVHAKGYVYNQFNLAERDDHFLAVVERETSSGESVIDGLTIPLSLFSTHVNEVDDEAYYRLYNDAYLSAVRFTKNYALLSAGYYDDGDKSAETRVWYWPENKQWKFDSPHAVDFFQPLGESAVGVTDLWGDGFELQLYDLSGEPRFAQNYAVSNRMISEDRSHSYGVINLGDTYYFGVPNVLGSKGAESSSPVEFDGLVDFNYFKVDRNFRLLDAGLISGSALQLGSGECEDSCFDWYGSARTFSMEGKVYALINFELVEAELEYGYVRELRRLSLQ